MACTVVGKDHHSTLLCTASYLSVVLLLSFLTSLLALSAWTNVPFRHGST